MPESPSNVARLSDGTLEYATRGTGAAVIVCHSTGGGYDQGLTIARLLHGFMAIAGSRAGYLRTPLKTGRSPTGLADAITKTPPNSSVKIVRQANSLPDRVAWFLTSLAVYGVLPLMIRDADRRFWRRRRQADLVIRCEKSKGDRAE